MNGESATTYSHTRRYIGNGFLVLSIYSNRQPLRARVSSRRSVPMGEREGITNCPGAPPIIFFVNNNIGLEINETTANRFQRRRRGNCHQPARRGSLVALGRRRGPDIERLRCVRCFEVRQWITMYIHKLSLGAVMEQGRLGIYIFRHIDMVEPAPPNMRATVRIRVIWSRRKTMIGFGRASGS
jgi:hypothetical protein